MKRVLICFVLVLMLMSSIIVLSACKDKSYDIKKLSTDYSQLTSGLSYVKMSDDYEISIDYKGSDTSDNSLKNTVESIHPYAILKNYNVVLNNELIFVKKYIKICSNDSFEASADERNAIKDKMENLKASLENLDKSFSSLDSTVEVYYQSGNLQSNVACLSKLKTTLNNYEQVFKSAELFADDLTSLYFNKVVPNSNKNFVEVEIGNFNPADAINYLDSKIYFEIASLTKVFVEKYAAGQANIEQYGSNNITSFVNAYATYNSQVSNLKADYNVNASILVISATKKAEFYELAIQAYNAHVLINNAIKNFNSASKNVDYASVGADSSDFDIACKNTVDSFNSLVENYRVVISNMLNLMEN